MIWIGICLLGAIALLPAVWFVLRERGVRLERESALALHRAQLIELERDLDHGLIAASEHATARTEVQRRLLSADGSREDKAAGRLSSGLAITASLVIVPVAAVGLYLTGGHPTLPPQPLAPRLAAMKQENSRTDTLVNQLRQGLTRMDPNDPNLVRGYLLLGQAEASREHYAQAAQAWHMALDHQFDPQLAVRTAEAQTRADGYVSPQSADLFRRALDAAPADAPWRMAAEARIAEAEHQK